MRLDITSFPIVWMREQAEGEEEDVAETRDLLIGLLQRDERFVLAAERLPGLADLTEASPEEKKMRAELFKLHRGQLTKLCAGMVIVGSGSKLPQAIAKAMAAFTGAMGVAVVFVRDAVEAEAVAHARLGR